MAGPSGFIPGQCSEFGSRGNFSQHEKGRKKERITFLSQASGTKDDIAMNIKLAGQSPAKLCERVRKIGNKKNSTESSKDLRPAKKCSPQQNGLLNDVVGQKTSLQ